MDSTQMTEVVDKIAEKFGLAADKVQPIAEEVIRQYAVRSMAYAIGLGTLMALSFAAVIVLSWMFSKYDDCHVAEQGMLAAGVSLLTITGIILGIVACVNICHAIAPLPSILGL